MANETFTATQATVLATDNDVGGPDGVIDPGDVVTTTVTITNNSTSPTPVAATGVQFSEILDGMTIVDQPGDDINVSPIAFDDAYSAVGNITVTVDAANGILQGPTATHLTLSADAEFFTNTIGANAATQTHIVTTGVIGTASGGSVTLNADGSFSYISAVGFEGTDSFTYTLRDTGLDGVAGNADDLTGTGTVTITVGPSVWFIDNTAAPGGNGTQASPFNSIAAFNAAQGTANGPDDGDFIYLRQGTGTYSEADGINLANNQTLIGAGQNLVVNGDTIETATSAPTIQVTGAGGEGVLLAQNNTLRGFDISSTVASADGIEDGGGTVGNLTISDVAISGTGQAVDIDQGGTLNVTLDSVTSTGASEEGIQLANVAGSFTATTVSLNGMAGDGVDLDSNSATVAINGGSIGNSNDPGGIGVDVNGGTGNVTIGASINKTTAGDVVEVTGRTTGTVDFNGNITSNTAGGGIDININTGGTVRFDGGMNLSTGATTAFNATGNTGMTLVVTDTVSTSNILATTTATALNVANTTIGAEGLTFQSISANGATNGIVLNNTGSSGGLTVTGNGSTAIGGDNSGGTIQNTTGVGISLTSTFDPSFTNMRVLNTTGHGVGGTDVTNFTFNYGKIDDSNTDALTTSEESNIGFYVNETNSTRNNLDGTVSIVGNQLTNAQFHGIDIFNFSGTINDITISNNTITSDTATANSQGGGIRLIAFGSATTIANITKATIDGNDINNFPSGWGIQVQGGNGNLAGPATGFVGHVGSGTDVINITNNDMAGQSAANQFGTFGIVTAVNGRGQGNFNIDGNNITNTIGTAISVGSFGFANTFATITDNVIDAHNEAGAQGIGAGTSATVALGTETPTLTVHIERNDISNTDGNGILVTARDASGTVNARIIDNIVDAPLAGNRNGIRVDSGNGISGDETVNLEIRGNTTAGTVGSLSQEGIGLRKQGTVANTNDFNIYDAPGGPSLAVNPTNQQVMDFVQALNPGSFVDPVTGESVLIISGSGFKQTTTAPPLLAAEGGVEAAAPDNEAQPPVHIDPLLPPATDTDGDAAPGDATSALQPGAAGTSPGGGTPATPATDTTAPQGTAATPGGATSATPTAASHPVIVDDGVLSQAELDYFVGAAIARWTATGLTTAQIDALKAMSFGVADLSSLNLGSFTPAQITLDADAAGRGWYLDGTPREDAEFGNGQSATRLTTDATQAPAGHYDLLTTVMHEMGHALGLGDRYEGTARDALMYGWLFTGERRLPGAGEADGAVAGSITTEEFAGSPISVGSTNSTTGAFTLPANKQVVIQWQATVDPQTNQLIVNPSNQGTVSATNAVGFPDKLTDDPAAGGANDPTVTQLDTLILGGTVWNDNGAGGGTAANGILDGTEPGVDGVQLSLFVDANDDNVPDTPGTPLVTGVVTTGGGTYSFTGLAPGNYIVRVDAANFTGVGALAGLQVSPVTSPEPPDPDTGDPDVDNDDNGSRTAGQPAFSNAITLAYNTEPTPGTGNDTNNTLDFGFFNNPSPDLTGLQGDTATFTEGDPAVLLDDASAPEVAATVTDDQANFNGGGLTVSITANEVAAEDVLGISTAGTVTLSNGTNNGSIVSVGGLDVGTVTSNGAGGNDLVVTFNTTNATPANVGTLINALTYFNSNTLNPSTLQRAIAVTVNDGLAGTDTETAFVNVADINDEPTLIATGNNPTFTEGGAPADIYSAVTASTVETGQTFASMTLTVTNVTDGTVQGQDEILAISGVDVALTNGNAVAVGAGTANVSLSGNTATVTLAGVGLTDAQLQALIDGLTYRNTSQNPTDADRVVTITEVVDNGSSTPPADNTSAPGITSTVNVDPVNDLPVLGGVDATPTYVENAAALVLDNSLTVTDVDDPNIESATVSITAGLVAGDVLAADTTGTAITASYLNGVLTLTGPETLANFREVLQKVTFESTSEDPTGGGANPTRTIFWGINDGTSSNNPVPLLTLNVTAVNDGPINIVPPSIAVIEDVASAITGFSFNDADSNLNPVVATLSVPSGSLAASGGGGVTVGGTSSIMTLTGTLADINTFIAGGNVTFTTAANAITNVNLTVTLNDQGNTGIDPGLTGDSTSEQDTDVVTLAVTAVNDAPVNTVPGAQVVNEDTNLGITGLSIADLDAGSGTLTTALSVGSGTLTVAAVGGGATVAGSGTNTVTLTGTLTQINTTFAAAGAVLYTGNADFNGADMLTMTTDDGGNSGVDPGLTPGPTSESDTDTVGITVNAVNDAPVNFLPASVTAPPDTDQVIAGLSIADVDVGAAGILSTQLQVDNGILTVASVGGGSVVGSGSNTVLLTGTLADINATLSAAGNVVYHGNTGFVGTDTLTMTTSDNGFTGSGGPLADSDMMSIQVPIGPVPWTFIASGDFNGDGTDDVLWQDPITGSTIEWLMSPNGGIGSNPGLPATAGWDVIASGDFNGDGTTDLLWKTATGGLTSEWLMSPNGGILSDAGVPATGGWNVIASGDFNGDGTTDLLWKTAAGGGLTSEWLMSPNGGIGSNPGLPATGGWDVIKTGDFNGDGTTDLLWKTAAGGGLTSEWLMSPNGGVLSDAGIPATGGWDVIASGDFNGDGTTDLLWKTAAGGGLTSEWLMSPNGGILSNPAGIPPTGGWDVVTTGDFNGDGTTDVLWKTATGGLTSEWLMSPNGGIGSNPGLPATAGWDVIASGDFNGDGTTDLLWKTATGGLTSEWLMSPNGGILSNPAGIPPTGGWDVVTTGDFNGDGTTDIFWETAAGLTSEWLMSANGGLASNPATPVAAGPIAHTVTDFPFV